MRDWLLDRGVAVDTFETAVSWTDLERTHAAVSSTLQRAAQQHAGGGITMAHLSHSYLDGACLYFTVLYPLDAPRGLEQWAAIKREVTQAIVDHGGTVSHHHGVGRDHSEWLESEKGALGLEVLSAVKRTLDPGGIMNPGKLLP
jgi:alkyldihydroxyacetonephosphate synthase